MMTNWKMNAVMFTCLLTVNGLAQEPVQETAPQSTPIRQSIEVTEQFPLEGSWVLANGLDDQLSVVLSIDGTEVTGSISGPVETAGIVRGMLNGTDSVNFEVVDPRGRHGAISFLGTITGDQLRLTILSSGSSIAADPPRTGRGGEGPGGRDGGGSGNAKGAPGRGGPNAQDRTGETFVLTRAPMPANQ